MSRFMPNGFKNATGVLAAAHKSAMLTKYIFVRLPLHPCFFHEEKVVCCLR